MNNKTIPTCIFLLSAILIFCYLNLNITFTNHIFMFFFGALTIISNLVSVIILVEDILINKIIKGLAIFILILITLISVLLFGLGVLLDYSSNEKIQKIDFDNYNVVVYRINCGAPCHYGLVITKEKLYLFGIVKTDKIIRFFDRGYDIQFEKIDDLSLKVISVEGIEDYRNKDFIMPKIGDIWMIEG